MSIEEAILLDTLRCRLNFLRRNNHLTAAEVAEKSAISLEDYLSYEEGKACPNVVELIFLADFHGVSVDYLIGRSEEQQQRLS